MQEFINSLYIKFNLLKDVWGRVEDTTLRKNFMKGRAGVTDMEERLEVRDGIRFGEWLQKVLKWNPQHETMSYQEEGNLIDGTMTSRFRYGQTGRKQAILEDSAESQ